MARGLLPVVLLALASTTACPDVGGRRTPAATGDGGPAGADAGPGDSGAHDAGPGDSGAHDAGPGDSGPRDAGPADSGPADSGPSDSGPRDSGPADSGPGPDGGLASCDQARPIVAYANPMDEVPLAATWTGSGWMIAGLWTGGPSGCCSNTDTQYFSSAFVAPLGGSIAGPHQISCGCGAPGGAALAENGHGGATLIVEEPAVSGVSAVRVLPVSASGIPGTPLTLAADGDNPHLARGAGDTYVACWSADATTDSPGTEILCQPLTGAGSLVAGAGPHRVAQATAGSFGAVGSQIVRAGSSYALFYEEFGAGFATTVRFVRVGDDGRAVAGTDRLVTTPPGLGLFFAPVWNGSELGVFSYGDAFNTATLDLARVSADGAILGTVRLDSGVESRPALAWTPPGRWTAVWRKGLSLQAARIRPDLAIADLQTVLSVGNRSAPVALNSLSPTGVVWGQEGDGTFAGAVPCE